jgi:peptide/nickel transport system permease protein
VSGQQLGAGPAMIGAGPAKTGAQEVRRSALRQWGGYLARRAAGMVVVLAVVLVLTFMIVRWVPGDPVRLMLGINATSQQVEQVRGELGLDRPLVAQFGTFITNLFHGDLGVSFVNQQPITQMIGERLPLTAELAVGGLLVVLILGFPCGIIGGVLQHSGKSRPVTSVFTAATSVIGALPEYIAGTLLIYAFALTLKWFPVQGASGFHGMLLPALAVGIAPAAVLARLVRNETVSVLSQEYILTAQSKRLSGRRLILRHVLPNVVTSSLTLGGLLLVALLGGTVITENVFNISGLGTQIVQSILRSDYPSIQGIILVLALLAVIINLAVDIVLGILDPRVLVRKSV